MQLGVCGPCSIVFMIFIALAWPQSQSLNVIAESHSKQKSCGCRCMHIVVNKGHGGDPPVKICLLSCHFQNACCSDASCFSALFAQCLMMLAISSL